MNIRVLGVALKMSSLATDNYSTNHNIFPNISEINTLYVLKWAFKFGLKLFWNPLLRAVYSEQNKWFLFPQTLPMKKEDLKQGLNKYKLNSKEMDKFKHVLVTYQSKLR